MKGGLTLQLLVASGQPAGPASQPAGWLARFCPANFEFPLSGERGAERGCDLNNRLESLRPEPAPVWTSQDQSGRQAETGGTNRRDRLNKRGRNWSLDVAVTCKMKKDVVNPDKSKNQIKKRNPLTQRPPPRRLLRAFNLRL